MDLKGFTTVDEVGADDSQVRYQEENFKPATAAEEIDYLNKILADIEKSNGSNKGKKFAYSNGTEGKNCRDNNDNVDQQCMNKIDKENLKHVCNTDPRSVSGHDSEGQKPVKDYGIEGQNSVTESDKGVQNSDGDCKNEGHVSQVQKCAFESSDLSHVDDILTQANDQHMLNHNTNSGQVQSGLSTEPNLITASLSFPPLDSSTSQGSDSNLINPNLSADFEDLGKFSVGTISLAALNETGSSELSPSTTNATAVLVNSSAESLSSLESRCYSARNTSNGYLSGEDVSGLIDKIPKDLNNEFTFSSIILGDIDNILANSGEQMETVQEEEFRLSKTQVDLSLVKSEPIDVHPQEELDFDGFFNDPAEEFKAKEEPKVKDEPPDFSSEAVDQVHLCPVKIFKSEDVHHDQPDIIPNVRYRVEGDKYYSQEQITAALIISYSSLAPLIHMDMFQNVGRSRLVPNLTRLEEIINNPNQIALEDADIVKLFVKNYGSSFSDWKRFFNCKMPSSRKHTGPSKRASKNYMKDIPYVGVTSAKGRRRKEKEKSLTSKKMLFKSKSNSEDSHCDYKETLKCKAITPKKEADTKKGRKKRERSLELLNIQTDENERNLACHITGDINLKSAKDDSNSLALSADVTKRYKGDGKQVSAAVNRKARHELQGNAAVDMKEKVEPQGPKDSVGYLTESLISKQYESLSKVDLVKPHASCGAEVVNCTSASDRWFLDTPTITPKEETLGASESGFMHSVSASAEIENLKQVKGIDTKCKPCSVHLFDIAKDKKYQKKVKGYLRLLHKGKIFVTQSEKETFAENGLIEFLPRLPGTGNKETDYHSLPVSVGLQNSCNEVDGSTEQNSSCFVQIDGSEDESLDAKGEKADKNSNIFVERRLGSDEDNSDERGNEDALKVDNEAPKICTESLRMDDKDKLLEKMDRTNLENEGKARFEKESKEKKRLKYEKLKDIGKEEEDMKKLHEEIEKLKEEKKVLAKNKIYDHVKWKNEKIKDREKKFQELCRKKRDRETRFLEKEDVSIIKECIVVTYTSSSSINTFRIPKKKVTNVRDREVQEPTSVLSKREEWHASKKSSGYSSNKKLIYDCENRRSKGERSSPRTADTRNQNQNTSTVEPGFPPQSKMKEGWNKKEMVQISGRDTHAYDSPMSGCGFNDSPGSGYDCQQYGSSVEHEMTVPIVYPSHGMERWGMMHSSSITEAQRKDPNIIESPGSELGKLHFGLAREHDTGMFSFRAPPPPVIENWVSTPSHSMSEYMCINSFSNESSPANSRNSRDNPRYRVTDSSQTEGFNMPGLGLSKSEHLIAENYENKTNTDDIGSVRIIDCIDKTLPGLEHKEIEETKTGEYKILHQYSHMDKKQKMRLYEKSKRQYYNTKKKYHDEKGERKQSRFEEYEWRKKEYYDLKRFLYEEKKKEYELKKKIQKENLAKLKDVTEDPKVQIECSQKDGDNMPEQVREDGQVKESGHGVHSGRNVKQLPYSPTGSPVTFGRSYSVINDPATTLGKKTFHESASGYKQMQKAAPTFTTGYEETTTTTPAYDFEEHPSYEQMEKESLTEAFYRYEHTLTPGTAAHEETEHAYSPHYEEINPACRSAHDSELKDVLMSLLKPLRQCSVTESRDETSNTCIPPRNSGTSNFVHGYGTQTRNLTEALALEPAPSSVSVPSSNSWPLNNPPPFSAQHLPLLPPPPPPPFPTLPVPPPIQVLTPFPISSRTPFPTAYPAKTSSASSLPIPLINSPALPVLSPISLPHSSGIESCPQLASTSVLPDSSVTSVSEQSSSHLHFTSQIARHCKILASSTSNCIMIDDDENDSQACNDFHEVNMCNESGASIISDNDTKFLATFGICLNSSSQLETNTHQNRNSYTRQGSLKLGKLTSKLMETSKQNEKNFSIHQRQEVLEQKKKRIEGTADVPTNTFLNLGSQEVIPVTYSTLDNLEMSEAAAVDRSDIQAVTVRETSQKPSSLNEPLLSAESTDQHTELEVVYSSIQEGSKDKKRTLGDEVPKYYQKMPLAQAVVDDCQDIPLVGLQYVLEVRQDIDVTIDGCYYICAICSKKMNAHTLIAHIKSVPHRLKFSEIHCRDIFEKYGTYSLKQWTAVLVKEFTMALSEVEAKMGRHKLAVAFEKDMSSVLTSLKDKISEISELSSKPTEKDVEENGEDPVNETPPSNEDKVPEPPTTPEETATSLTNKESPLAPVPSSENAVPSNKLLADKKGDKSQPKENEKQPQEISDDVFIIKDVKKVTGQGFQKRNYRPGPNSRHRSSSKSPSKSLSPKRRTRSRSPSPKRRKSRSPSSKRIKSSRRSPSKESGIRSQTGDRKRRYSRSPGPRSRSRSRSHSRATRIRRSRSRSHSRGPRSHRRSHSRSRSRQRSTQKRPERWFRRSPLPRRREPSEERNKRVAERKLQDFREVEIRLKARHKNEQVVYEKNPESHPQYTHEWKMFWEHRCQQLVKQGLNPFQYDFKSEWALFWPQRMRELLAIEYKSKRNSLLARFNMEDPDESNVETNKTSNNETSPTWNSTGTKQDTVSRIDRSPSPWEGDSRSGAKVKNPSPPPGVRMANNVTCVPPPSVEPPAKKFEEEFSVLGTLKLLNDLEDQLGSFGPAIITLLGKAVDCSQKGGDALELFKDPDNLVLVRYAREKLSSQISAGILGVNALVCTQMAVERAMWLQSQAEKFTNEGKYLGLDIASIARATLGKDTLQIAQFIAQHLLQVGKSNASEEDLQNILFAVSAAHTKCVVEHAAKQNQSVNPNMVDVSAGSINSSYAAATTAGIPPTADAATGIPPKPPISSSQESQRPKPLFPSAMSTQTTNTNDSKSSDSKSAGLSMLQSAYDDENAKDMEKLSIEDLQSLLANFRSLVPEEQQALTAYLKKLEATDSKKVMKLREEMQKSAKNAAKMAKPTPSTTANSHQPAVGLSKDAQHPGSNISASQQPAQAIPSSQPVYSGIQKAEISKPPLNYVSGENDLHSRSPLSISEAFREFASDHQSNNPQDNMPYGDKQNPGSRRPFMEKDGPGYSGLDSSHQRYQEPDSQDYYYRDCNKPLGPEGPQKYGMQNYYPNFNKGYPPRGNQFPNNPNRLDEENWYNDRPRHSYGPPNHF